MFGYNRYTIRIAQARIGLLFASKHFIGGLRGLLE
jgi:hypothetical protein